MFRDLELYFSVLMLFGASQAVTGIYLLLKDRRRPFANNMLALLLFIWGFSCYWFFAYIHKGPFFSIPVTTFIGPLLALVLFPPIFLYVKYLFYHFDHFPKKDHIHFVPVYVFILFTLYLFIQSGFSIPNMRSHPWYHDRTILSGYIATVQGPLYFFLTNKILRQRHRLLKEHYSEIESRRLGWFQVINYSFALVFVIGGLSTLVRITYLDPYILYMAYHAVIALSIFYITLMIYKYPLVFQNSTSLQEIYKDSDIKVEKDTTLPLTQSPLLPINENVRETDIILKLEKLMQEQKLYKNPNFSLNDLAAALSESRNSLSHLLNNNLNQTFYNYINEQRIAESKRLLSNPDLLNYTIEGIAAESGFKSMSVFYRFFKEMEGVTPAVYRKNAGPVK